MNQKQKDNTEFFKELDPYIKQNPDIKNYTMLKDGKQLNEEAIKDLIGEDGIVECDSVVLGFCVFKPSMLEDLYTKHESMLFDYPKKNFSGDIIWL